jgi:hypothetical protein
LRTLGWLLRVFSYLLHTILCLFLFGVGWMAHSVHSVPKLGFLPFTDEHMLNGIFALSVAGLVSTALAVTGIFRYLFPIWTAVVLWLMIRGFFLSAYSFASQDAFRNAVLLTIGALVAFLGGLSVLTRKRR